MSASEKEKRWWRMRASEKGVVGSGRGDGQSRNKRLWTKEKGSQSVCQTVLFVRSGYSPCLGRWSQKVKKKKEKRRGSKKGSCGTGAFASHPSNQLVVC